MKVSTRDEGRDESSHGGRDESRDESEDKNRDESRDRGRGENEDRVKRAGSIPGLDSAALPRCDPVHRGRKPGPLQKA